MLERSHLEILAAIEKHGTLTQAAEALHLSQSALSHSIKKLESQLSINVWVKEGRQLRLTLAGEQILKMANRVLPQFLHTEQLLGHIASGEKGILRIGMECHPCYRWLLKVIEPFLQNWPQVDVDVRQAFQFGGLGALLNYDIDLLVTPDPLFTDNVKYIPVFDYEHRLVVSASHPLASQTTVAPEQLSREVLYTYPVEPQRLDIFSQFLHPAQCTVRQHKIMETTEIMLQMVAAGRGMCALPGWLADEYAQTLPIKSVRLGDGLYKQIHLGLRAGEDNSRFIDEFINLARTIR
ncbi:LysR family transcriptional regulator [Alteromonas halophila]|uniref:HTH-type transcriptional regulator MetR n=1 Tax=Alteromonas halophila TaxID=516698 RepID=A0A918JDQ2_9ALTE|nr:LysR family transcriptional regulator [Alteromonas halophila]GGW74309.1 LysR family transcriptional regulator [Alteromonas halophila]